MTQAVAYLRTSSAANVGKDKDSDKRQMLAIEDYARHADIEIILPPYYDASISGADPHYSRPGFSALLTYLAEHPDVRTILVETAERFARDLVLQEVGYAMLTERGISLIAVDSPESFLSDTPSAVLFRQVRGAVSQFEKAMLVLKLRGARIRKREKTGKCEGRKSHAERHPGAVAMARKLRRANPHTHTRLSYRAIATKLAEAGHKASSGKPFSSSAIASMLVG